MVVITQELWQVVLDKLEEGHEKATIMESLLNNGFSVLEANAIYHKAKGEFLKRVKPRVKKEGMSFRKWLGQPPQVVTLIAIITGILLPLLYYALVKPAFSFPYGLVWFVYVLGTWLACIGTGNIPANFGTEEGIMVAQCKSFGSNSVATETAVHLGGFVFSLIIGVLLVLYMTHLSRRCFSDDEMVKDVKKKRYFSAWFNGTVGLSILTALTYLLLHGFSGQYALDMHGVMTAEGFAPEVVRRGIGLALLLAWIISATIVIFLLAKKRESR